MERVQLVPVCSPPAHAAALPRGARHAVVAVHILDTVPDPRQRVVKVIEAEELIRKAQPPTPTAGRMASTSARWAMPWQRPGGIFVLDPKHSRSKGSGRRSWTAATGVRLLVAPRCDTMITSEWGTPNMVENGVTVLLGGKYGHALHVASQLSASLAKAGAGPEYQMVLKLRPAHDPEDVRVRRRRHQPEGSVGVGLDVAPRKQRPQRRLARSQGDRDSASRRTDDLPPLLRASARFHRSSPISTSRSTIVSSMSRAGARASWRNSTSPIRSTLSRPAQ